MANEAYHQDEGWIKRPRRGGWTIHENGFYANISYLMPILTGSVPTAAAPSLKVLWEVTNNGELCRVLAPQRESGTLFVVCNTDQMRYMYLEMWLKLTDGIINLSVVMLLQTGFSEWFLLESVPTSLRLTALICCGGVESTALSLQNSPR